MGEDERPTSYLLSKAKNDAADASELLVALKDELKANLILTTVIDVAYAKLWEAIEGIQEVRDRIDPGNIH